MLGVRVFQKPRSHLTTFRRNVTRRKFRTEDPDLAPEFEKIENKKRTVKEGFVGYRFAFQSFGMSKQFF
jgi:hypothetical protein